MGISVAPSIRKDLPKRHQCENMLLTQTPVGKDASETQKILQELVGKGYQSEFQWALYPPVGPSPKAAWQKPSVDLKKDIPTSIYIIKFPVPLSLGSDFMVFKPGITSRPIVGTGGRYSAKFGPEVVYQKMLTPPQAWAAEQKLLMALPKTPCDWLFEDWIWYWTTYEDMLDALPDSQSQVTIGGKDFLQVKKVRDELHRLKEERLLQRPSFLINKIVKTKTDQLGLSEWRSWPYGLSSLVETADKIVDFCIHFS